MRRPWLLPLILVLALLAGGGVWYWLAERPIAVEMVRPTRGPALDLVYATGFVDPTHPVAVAARTTAPVVQVLAREGDAVKAGQVLVRLDDAEQRGLLDQARAQAQGATLAEQRARQLFTQGWVTRAALDSAVAAGQAARAAVRALDARLDQMVVRAGIAGVILKRDVEPGDVATPGKVLFQLGNPAETRITATVDERDIPRIRVGQEALMSTDALRGEVIPAKVSELTPGGDPNQRAFRVRLDYDVRRSLPFGLTLEVNIVIARHERALLIPATAISKGHVWLVEGGKARRRAIKLGISGTEKVEIVGGLKGDEMLIAAPPENLADGARVSAAKPDA